MRLLTSCTALLIVILGFLLLIGLDSYRLEYSSNLPDPNFCLTELPKLYNLRDYRKITFELPPTSNNFRKRRNDRCLNEVSNSIWTQVAYNNDYSEIGLYKGSTYNVSQCLSNQRGIDLDLCPNFKYSTILNDQIRSAYCPCVIVGNKVGKNEVSGGGGTNKKMRENCPTTDCSKPPNFSKNRGCMTFAPEGMNYTILVI